MATIILDATTISGLTQPTYNSGAANKLYVDNLSGNLITKFIPSTSMINKSDGDVLTWDASNNFWSAQAATTGGLDGDTLSGNFFTKTSGQHLWDFSSNSKGNP